MRKIAERSGHYELTHENTSEQFRGGTVDSAMNETSHKQMFQHTGNSYNEQRDIYTEQPINDSTRTEQEQIQQKVNHDSAEKNGISETIDISNISAMSAPEEIADNIKLGQAQEIAPFTRYTTGKLYSKDDQIVKIDQKISKYDAARGDVTQKTERYFYYGKKGIYGGRSHIRQEYFNGQRMSGSRRLIVHSDQGGRRHGRIQHYYGTTSRKATKKDFEEYLNRRTRKRAEKTIGGRLLFRKSTDMWKDENIAEDETIGDMKRKTRRLLRGSIYATSHNKKIWKKYSSTYYRLDLAQQKRQILLNDKKRLQDRKLREEMKKHIREQKSREQKRRLKKAMVQYQRAENGSFISRARQNILAKRKKKQYQRQARKRIASMVFSGAGIIIALIAFLLVMFLGIIALTDGSAEMAANTVSMNDYTTLTEAVAYLNDRETELDVYLNADRDALEDELEEEYGPDIYEFIYDLADFGFSANNLMAFLSARYGSFTLEDVKPEMDSIFEEMYTLSVKVKTEKRMVEEIDPDTGETVLVPKMVNICYVTLKKKDLDYVITDRLTSDEEFAFTGYRLSGGGQQIFSPVMKENWTDLITSNFGTRLHPIDGEVKQHNGVDIGIPEGTQLYSAVEGTVTKATYTDSTGYMVTITDADGYKVIYMHMKSYSVAQNQKVKAGQFIGLSGNTGNSTGPHLHLGVQKPDGTYCNPIFFIPATSADGDY